MSEHPYEPGVCLPRDASLPEWSADNAARFEVAIELLSQLVGMCSARIAEEETRSSPNPAAIAEYRRLSAGFAQRQMSLNPHDTAAVTRVAQDYQLMRVQLDR